jgi:uncharacterized protein YutE (UPF0331/DUF86 family)
MRPRTRSTIYTIVGVAAALTVGLVVFATGSGNANTIAVAAAVAGLGAAVSSFFAARAQNSEAEASRTQLELAYKLIEAFTDIENESASPDSHQPPSLRDVKATMASSGVWDDQDQISFDVAVRARNAIVHGDLAEVDKRDLQTAVEKADQLLRKMQERSRHM